MLTGTLLWSHNSLSTSFPVDSGADDNFLDKDLALQSWMPIETLDTPQTILDLNGRPIARLTH